MKLLRKQKNLSQQQLGNMLGVTAMSICNYEQGKRAPDADYIIKFCNKFNISADYLLLDQKTNIYHFNTEPLYDYICGIIEKYQQAAVFEIANTDCAQSDSLDALDAECNCMRYDVKKMLEGLFK